MSNTENKVINAIVKYLPPDLLAKFRCGWGLSNKSFDFMEESKEIKFYHVSIKGENKVFMT